MKQTPTSGPNPQQQEAIHITEGPTTHHRRTRIRQDLHARRTDLPSNFREEHQTGASIRLNLHRESRRRTHLPNLDEIECQQHPHQPQRDVYRHLPFHLSPLH